MLSGNARRLCWHGVFLFLLGLLNGALVPYFTNPRMGLSAHLAAVQSGMALLIFGFLWPHLRLRARERATLFLVLVSTYAIWVALALAAVFGTSRATPIAGAGFEGGAAQEGIVTILLYAGSVGLIAGVVLMLAGLGRSAASDRS